MCSWMAVAGVSVSWQFLKGPNVNLHVSCWYAFVDRQGLKWFVEGFKCARRVLLHPSDFFELS